MPLFDFHCHHCGCTCELLVKSARQKVACPECGSTKMQRLLSTFAVRAASRSPYESLPCCGEDSPCTSRPCEATGVCPRDE